MKLDLEPGRYVVAVSGGVDSMVLLDLLRQQPDKYQIVVAHLNHGIRPEASLDEIFVKTVAEQHGLVFYSQQAKLGSKASEAVARSARYEFLQRIRQQINAKAVITAHHRDDLLETAILNLLRGTAGSGLYTLAVSHYQLRRPLVSISKQQLINYADTHELSWREDSTNSDTKYLRNYVRQKLLPNFTEADKAELLRLIYNQQQIDQRITGLLMSQIDDQIDRQYFASLPHAVARELLARWLRAHHTRDFDRSAIERLVVAAKTGRSGQSFSIIHKVNLRLTKQYLALDTAER